MEYARWLSLLVLCPGFPLIVVDMTIVNVALPSIGRDLRLTAGGLAWIIKAYLVAFARLLLLAGRLADLVGSMRVFLRGLGVFSAASLACGLSTSPLARTCRPASSAGPGRRCAGTSTSRPGWRR
jgi:MFS family permease